MIAQPETLRAFLARASRRIAWISAAEGAAAGLVLASIAAIAGLPARGALTTALLAGVSLGVVGIVARLFLSPNRRAGVATLVERRAPQCRNLVITADELPKHRVTE